LTTRCRNQDIWNGVSGKAMRVIELDARNWRTELDFYNALLAALGAPEWHGRNLNALTDSMIYGGINAVEPPYSIRIRGTQKLAKDVRDQLETTKRVLGAARAEFRARRGHDVEVEFEPHVP
jgi:RNAse (barnase) inhibitor barstar